MREGKEPLELDVKEMFKILTKRLWIIALCALLTGAAVFVYVAKFVSVEYCATVTMYINNKEMEETGGYVSSANLTTAQKLVDTYVNLIKNPAVLEKVIEDTGASLTVGQIQSMLSAEAVDDTAIFEVNVTSSNPQLSANIANSIAKIAPQVISGIVDGSYAKVVYDADVPTIPVPPRRALKVTLGAFIGALVAALFFILRNVLDTHVRTEEELERIDNIPVLGTIPDFTQPIKEPKKKKGGR